ncbi:MAG: GDYXXLXY domain-containing protein [Ottowia sp.]
MSGVSHSFLHQLVARLGLSPAQGQALWALARLHGRPAAWARALEQALAALAALLLGAGLIFWVAANWPELARASKLALLQAAVLAPALVALAALRRWPRAGAGALLLATLALGALLAFVGQTYQTGADAWQLFAAWAALALPWALAARRALLWGLWLLLAALALALWGQPQWLLMLDAGDARLALALAAWCALLALPWALARLRLCPPGLALARLATLLTLAFWQALGLLGLFVSRESRLYELALALSLGLAVWLWRGRDVVRMGLALLAVDGLLVGGALHGLLRISGSEDALLAQALLAMALLGGSGVLLARMNQRRLAAEEISEEVAAEMLEKEIAAEERSEKEAAEKETPQPQAEEAPPSAGALVQLAMQRGLLPPEALAAWQEQQEERVQRHWMFAVLGFFGAQLAAWPLVGFVLASLEGLVRALTGASVLDPAGAFLVSLALHFVALALLRERGGQPQRDMFIGQIGFSLLLAALAMLGVALGGVFSWENETPALLIGTLWLCMLMALVRVPWAQALLGALAVALALAVRLRPLGAADGWELGLASLFGYPQPWNLAALALLWAASTVGEARAAHPLAALHARAGHALGGAGAALLLAAGAGMWPHFARPLIGAATGSADAPEAGSAALLAINPHSALQLALAALAAFWLGRHWRIRLCPLRQQALFALAWGALALAALALPHAGVIALIGAAALGTHRRALLALALLMLALGLGGFYYALAWPLVHKAALLAALGAALALGLLALHPWPPAGSGPAASAPPAAALARWQAPALIAAGTLAALALVRLDVAGKEEVIAHGEKIYLRLAPRDPRSLMQGDYMALNFDLPEPVRKALHQLDARSSPTPRARVIARLDERGVATVLRVAAPETQPLAANERLLPVQLKNGSWTLVTDAFFFPEGLGRPFARARFGEFRALPDGRALLVGLADEHLHEIQPGRAGDEGADEAQETNEADEAPGE